MICAIVLLSGIGLVNPRLFGWATSSLDKALLMSTSRVDTSDMQYIQIKPSKLIAQISIIGKLVPKNLISITSPFDGTLKNRNFEFGQKIERLQPLLLLNTADIEIQVREAEALSLKAAQFYSEVKAWDTSADVVRARQTVSTAELQLRSLRQKLSSTKRLLEKGIVPQQEYADLIEQEQGQRLSLASAKQDLDGVLNRGGPANLRVSAIEAENAEKRLRVLQTKMAGASITAPTAGVALRPNSNLSEEQGKSVQLEPGARLFQGQVLLTIGDLNQLAVVGQIDENDINKVFVGQEATLTGTAFGGEEAIGQVSSVGAEALPATDGSRTALFDIRVDLKQLSDKQKKTARIGMSVDLRIAYYVNQIALIVPISMVQVHDTQTFVLRKTSNSTTPEEVRVRLGLTTENGVEIIDGLQAGDFVFGSQP